MISLPSPFRWIELNNLFNIMFICIRMHHHFIIYWMQSESVPSFTSWMNGKLLRIWYSQVQISKMREAQIFSRLSVEVARTAGLNYLGKVCLYHMNRELFIETPIKSLWIVCELNSCFNVKKNQILFNQENRHHYHWNVE